MRFWGEFGFKKRFDMKQLSPYDPQAGFLDGIENLAVLDERLRRIIQESRAGLKQSVRYLLTF